MRYYKITHNTGIYFCNEKFLTDFIGQLNPCKVEEISEEEYYKDSQKRLDEFLNYIKSL